MTSEWYHSSYETARTMAESLATRHSDTPGEGDAFLANGNWKLMDNGAKSDVAGLSGRVLRSSLGAWPTLTFEGELGGAWSLVLGKLSFRPHGAAASEVLPTPSTFLVQEPYLVVPQAIASDVGLRMVVQFVADASSITMDIRLETIAPLDHVSLALDLSWNGVELQPRSNERGSAGRYSRKDSAWFDAMKSGDFLGGVVTDLGESGFVDRLGDSWRLVMFEQPLEKGVILVGRFGIIGRSPSENAVSFRQNHEKQLERPTFL